jgi:hypothetical protein
MDDPNDPATGDPPAVAEVHDVLERARRGDLAVLPRLRELLDGHPELWRHYGDLAGHARWAWIELIAGPNLALKDSLGRWAAEVESELAGHAPSPIERLLAGRAASAWLQVHHADAIAAQNRDAPLAQARFLQERQDRAQRRYLTALGALATLRRLMPRASAGAASGKPGGARDRGDGLALYDPAGGARGAAIGGG